MAICDFCNASSDPGRGEDTGPDAELPLTWVTSVENGRSRTYCGTCAREHLRAIESKLDSEWW